MNTMNILTKEEFCKTMQSLAHPTRRISDSEFYDEVSDKMIELMKVLKTMFMDDEDWISYYFVEMDSYANYPVGFVVIGNERVKLCNAGDLYDILLRNMKKKGFAM